jgi:head-tail adaptor
MIKAGGLDYITAWDEPASESDGMGGVRNGWHERHRCPAHLRFLRGGETVQAARLEGRQPVVVTIRSSGPARAIMTNWRMRDLRSGAVYQVVAPPVPTDDRAGLEITCESRGSIVAGPVQPPPTGIDAEWQTTDW